MLESDWYAQHLPYLRKKSLLARMVEAYFEGFLGDDALFLQPEAQECRAQDQNEPKTRNPKVNIG